MQDGAGTVGLTNMFDSLIGEMSFVEKKLAVKRNDDIIVQTRESLYYYEIYRKLFGCVPQYTNDLACSCPYCHAKIVVNAKFCRMCGMFPLIRQE